jgi:hypothetical protein
MPLDPKKDLTNVVKERAKSPVFGTFVLAWFAFNYDTALFLLYNDGYQGEELIKLVGEMLTIRKSFWYPLSVTAVLVMLYPWVTVAVSTYVKLLDILREWIHFKLAKIEICPLADVQELQTKIEEMTKEHRREVLELQEGRRVANAELDSQREAFSRRIKELQSGIDKRDEAIKSQTESEEARNAELIKARREFHHERWLRNKVTESLGHSLSNYLILKESMESLGAFLLELRSRHEEASWISQVNRHISLVENQKLHDMALTELVERKEGNLIVTAAEIRKVLVGFTNESEEVSRILEKFPDTLTLKDGVTMSVSTALRPAPQKISIKNS